MKAIAESVYDGLEPWLMLVAPEGVRAYLEKLADDGIAADLADWQSL